MKRAGLLALLAVLAPSAACAEPSFDVFEEFCLSGKPPQAALAAAEAKGWRPIPKAQLASFPTFTKSGPPPVVDGRMDGEFGPGMLNAVMVVGRAARVDDEIAIGSDFCVLGVRSADMAALTSELGRYAAVPPNTDLFENDTIAFAWRDGPAGRRPVTRAEMESPAAVGAKILVAEGNERFVMIALLTPIK